MIELLISIFLILVITAVAITSIVQMLTMTRRLQALQTMDASAKTLYEKLSGELAAMHPCAAVWLTSDPADSSVELVFMRCKEAPLDHIDSLREWGRAGATEMGYTDMVWSRWYWKWDPVKVTGTVYAASSRTARWTRVLGNQARDYWKIPGGSKLGNSYFNAFILIPQPVQETGTATSPNSPKDLLNTNAWQSAPATATTPAIQPIEKTDYGDYEDLLRNSRPLMFRCSALKLELVSRDGTSRVADGDTALAWAAEGSVVDGSDKPGLAPADAKRVLDARPSLVRLRFTLSDEKTGASRSYSFSCPTSGIPSY